MRTTAGAVLLTVGLAIAPARAEGPTAAGAGELPQSQLPGANEPAFREALAVWLGGDDAGSIPALVTLANEDNLAAQMLLGAIDVRDMGRLTPWMRNLSRAEYSGVFRRMDTESRFGTPWLSVAAEGGSRLAELLPHPRVDASFNADPALELAALGEPRATTEHLTVLFNQGQWAEAARLWLVASGTGTQAMAWAAATHLRSADPAFAALPAAGAAAFEAGTMDGYLFVWLADRQAPGFAVPEEALALARDVMRGRSIAHDAEPLSADAAAFLDDWLATADQAQLLRRWCAARCPEAGAACRGDLYAMMQGYWTLPVMESSPLETLIPQEHWIATPRALQVMEHYATGIPRAAPEPMAMLERLSVAACVKDGLAEALVTTEQ